MKVKIYNSPTQNEFDEIDLALTTRRGTEYFIGRSPDSDLVLDSDDVSRQHGKFFSKSGNYYFCDLGSRNGTIINGKIAEKNHSYILKNDDTIRIGDFALMLKEDMSLSEGSETVQKIVNPSMFSNWKSSQNANAATPSPESVSQPQEVFEPVISESIAFATPSEEEINNAEEFVNTSEEGTLVQSNEVSATDSANIAVPNNAVELQADSEISNAINNESVGSKIPVEEAANLSSTEPEHTIVQVHDVFQSSEDKINSDAEQVAEQIHEGNVPEVISQKDNFDSDAEVAAPTHEGNTSEAISQEAEEIAVQTQEGNPPEVEIVSRNVTLNSSTTVERGEELVSETASLSTSEFVVQELKVVNQETEQDAVENISEEESFTQLAKILEDKQIVLISHETKKSQLTELITEHQEFLSYCRTRTWQTFSDYLYSETGLSVTEEIPPATSGGYQAINSLINSGNIIAVIFLRDFIVPQPGQTSEEALLRTCNINEILLATNLLTAQAVIHYLKNMKD